MNEQERAEWIASRQHEHEHQVEQIKKMLGEGCELFDIARALRVDLDEVGKIKYADLMGPRIMFRGQVIGDPVEAEAYIARFEEDVRVELDDAESGHILNMSGLTVPEGRRIILYGPPTDVTCLHEIAHLRTTLDHVDAWADMFKSLLRAAGLPRRWRAVSTAEDHPAE